MTKRHSRLFFIISTVVFATVFMAMTIHSHTQFGELTNADELTEEVIAGRDVWHAGNCVNCHTLMGEGAYYAPDLTKITDHRSEAYLKAFMQDPSRFYSEKKNRRLMPNPELDDVEIENLLAFLTWISKIDNQGWPPRPILVTGSTFPGTGSEAGRVDSKQAAADGDAGQAPAAAGEALYTQVTPGCNSCHSTAPGVDMAGPSLAGVSERAEKIINSADYTGDAEDVDGYLRESIVAPSAHVVPGDMYSAGGTSFMPVTYADSLTDEQIEQLVAYLRSLK